MARWGPHRVLFGTPPALRSDGAGDIGADSAYNYVLGLRDAASGAPLDPPAPPEGLPTFFGYGSQKPFAFHSAAMLEAIRRGPASRVVEYDCGHWVPTDAAQGLSDDLAGWLAELTALDAERPVEKPQARQQTRDEATMEAIIKVELQRQRSAKGAKVNRAGDQDGGDYKPGEWDA